MMISILDDDDSIFAVVMNHDEQYSIWPVDRDIPAGWSTVGKTGKKKELLEYIEQIWTDMRPLGLRTHMEAAAESSERTSDDRSS